MSRAKRRDLATIIAVAATLAFAVLLASAAWRSVDARPPAPVCWWAGTTLHATDLPDEWSLTASPIPTGMSNTEPTFERTYPEAFTAYFWTRGGPYTALFKPGKQFNDYKPVCVAVP